MASLIRACGGRIIDRAPGQLSSNGPVEVLPSVDVDVVRTRIGGDRTEDFRRDDDASSCRVLRAEGDDDRPELAAPTLVHMCRKRATDAARRQAPAGLPLCDVQRNRCGPPAVGIALRTDLVGAGEPWPSPSRAPPKRPAVRRPRPHSSIRRPRRRRPQRPERSLESAELSILTPKTSRPQELSSRAETPAGLCTRYGRRSEPGSPRRIGRPPAGEEREPGATLDDLEGDTTGRFRGRSLGSGKSAGPSRRNSGRLLLSRRGYGRGGRGEKGRTPDFPPYGTLRG